MMMSTTAPRMSEAGELFDTSSSSDESQERSAAIEKKIDKNQKLGRKISSSSDSSAFSFVHCSPGSIQDTLSTIDVEDIDFKLLRDTEKLSFFSNGEGNVVCAPILERSVEGDVSIAANKIDDDIQNIPFMVATSSGTLSVLPSHDASNDDWGINSKQTVPLSLSKSAPTTPTRDHVVHMNSRDSNMKRSPPRNPFDAFGEYVVKLFQQAVLHEEELEMQETVRRRQSQLNIKWLDDPSTTIINDTTINTAVGNKTNKETGVDLSTPRLEALAAVQAISGFQNLSVVKKQLTAERTHLQSLHTVNVEQNNRNVIETTLQVPVVVPAETEAITKVWEKQWEQFVHEKDNIKYTEVMIKSLALPMSVDEFYNYVLADNADHSFTNFMRNIGELDVETTKWGQLLENPPPTNDGTTSAVSSLSSSRTINYIHPVNSPLAPPTAKAVKQQTLHKFGTAGICVESCTVVEEVPMADCFVVDDRLWVHKTSQGCVMSVTFQIRFVKGTLFRRIIENQTRKEYQSFWEQFSIMVQSLVESQDKDAATVEMFENEGLEMTLATLMNSFRRLSCRLSSVGTAPTNLEVLQPERVENEWRILFNCGLDFYRYIRKVMYETDSVFILVTLAFLFLLRQMLKLSERLENIEKNQAILLILMHDNSTTSSCSA